MLTKLEQNFEKVIIKKKKYVLKHIHIKTRDISKPFYGKCKQILMINTNFERCFNFENSSVVMACFIGNSLWIYLHKKLSPFKFFSDFRSGNFTLVLLQINHYHCIQFEIFYWKQRIVQYKGYFPDYCSHCLSWYNMKEVISCVFCSTKGHVIDPYCHFIKEE